MRPLCASGISTFRTILYTLLLFITTAIFFILITESTGEAEIITVDDSGGADHIRIMDAIENATNGDTILVFSGTYEESIVVTNSVSIIGDGSDETLIRSSSGNTIIEVLGNNTTISGFTITGATSNGSAAILVYSQNNIIRNNMIHENDRGACFENSHSNTITNNTFHENTEGMVFVNGSTENMIRDCMITDNTNNGVLVKNSGNNTFQHNTITGNRIGMSFINVTNSSHVTDINFNDLSSNSNFGIHSDSGKAAIINATDNWWGHESGPYHADNNSAATGCNVSDHIDFSPWLLEPWGTLPIASVDSVFQDPIAQGTAIDFTGHGTSNYTISRYVWRSIKDGEFLNTTIQTSSFQGLSNGSHTIFFKVMNEKGFWSEEVRTTLVINGIPVARIESITPDPALKGERVEFTSTAIDDGTISRYVWISNIDGEFQNDTISTFEYNLLTNGTHIIDHLVQDNLGFWSNIASETLIINGLPVAHIGSISSDPSLNGEPVEFTSTATDDRTITRYVWISDIDGEFQNDTFSTFEYSFLSNGTHTIDHLVQDDLGFWSDITSTSLEINGRPIAKIDSISPGISIYGEQVTFKGIAFDDGSISRIVWWSNIDEEFVNGSSINVTDSTLSVGYHTIRLRVQDDLGVWSEYSTSSLIINGVPEAVIVLITPDPALNTEQVTLTGSGVDEGTIIRYHWTSDKDGKLYNGTQATIQMTGMSNGSHIITLRVQDDLGEWSPLVESTLVINGKPVSIIETDYPDPVLDIDPLFFKGNGTDDGSIVLYQWRSNRDGIFFSGASNEITITYLSNGTHQIFLRVQDDLDGWSDEVMTSLTINGKPRAHITSDFSEPVLHTESVWFRGDADEDGSIVQAIWTSDREGEIHRGALTDFPYLGLSNGTHTISLQMEDDFGIWSDLVFTQIRINGRPVGWMESTPPGMVLDIDPLTFRGNGTDDGSIINYEWRSDRDGIFYYGPSKEILITDLSNGSHTIYLRVQDDFGGWSYNDMTTIFINGKPISKIQSLDPELSLQGEPVHFNGLGIDDGTIVRAVWSSDQEGEFYNGSFIDQQYSDLSNGSHRIAFRIQDQWGVWSDVQYSNLVINGKPVVTMMNISSREALDVEFITFSGISYDDGMIQAHIWRSSRDGEFYNGSGASFSSSFMSSSLSNGSHRIYYRVMDDLGALSDEVGISIFINGKPVGSIVSALPDPAHFGEVVNFTGIGTDDEWITRYVWYTDENELYNGSETSFLISILSVGETRIYLRVQDNRGVWSDVTVHTITLHSRVLINHPPVLAIRSPENNSRVSGTISIQGEVQDAEDDHVTIEMKVNDGSWQIIPGGKVWERKIDTTELQNGDNLISFRSHDGNEYSQVHTIILNVENHDKTLVETSPLILVCLGIIFVLSFSVICIFRECLKYGIYTLLSVPLYGKYESDDVLSQSTRQEIYTYLQANPGSNLSNIHKDLGCSYSPLIHHLNILEKEGLIQSRKDHNWKVFYPRKSNNNPGSDVSIQFLTPIQKRIIDHLDDEGPSTLRGIEHAITDKNWIVGYNIDRLLERGYIIDIGEDRNPQYMVSGNGGGLNDDVYGSSLANENGYGTTNDDVNGSSLANENGYGTTNGNGIEDRNGEPDSQNSYETSHTR